MNKNNRISEFSLILITKDNHTFLVVLIIYETIAHKIIMVFIIMIGWIISVSSHAYSG